MLDPNEDVTTESSIEDTYEIPIIEIFGPTLQGEGALAGQTTHFIRTGGCGYRCSWCDTMYAVDPKQVKAIRIMMTPRNIVEKIKSLGHAPWVTLSGGDPCLHKRMGELIVGLHRAGYRISVETQGQFWQDWLLQINQVTISPKPPSSGMETDWEQLDFIVNRITHSLQWAHNDRELTLKIVVFDALDLDYVRIAIGQFPNIKFFLSAGTHQPKPGVVTATWQDHVRVLANWRKLAEMVLMDEKLRSHEPPIVVGCQQHVLLELA